MFTINLLRIISVRCHEWKKMKKKLNSPKQKKLRHWEDKRQNKYDRKLLHYPDISVNKKWQKEKPANRRKGTSTYKSV